MYYLSSENKGADLLRGYREADLRLCFRICRLLVFPWGGTNKAETNILFLSIYGIHWIACLYVAKQLGYNHFADLNTHMTLSLCSHRSKIEA